MEGHLHFPTIQYPVTVQKGGLPCAKLNKIISLYTRPRSLVCYVRCSGSVSALFPRLELKATLL